MQHHNNHHRPVIFEVIVAVWTDVKVGKRTAVRLLTSSYEISGGTLAEAKATLTGKLFYVAKIYERGELVATVRGTQTKQNPVS